MSTGAKKGADQFRQSRLVGLGLSVGEAVAPGVAGRWATNLWATIPSRRFTGSHTPPGGVDFETRAQQRVVRGTYWGDGPVVYLVHGWAGEGRQMAGLIDPLRRSGYRIVAFDGPSHGRSDPGPSGPRRSNPIEFGRAFDAVAALHGPAHAVIAHSMGAMATMLTLRFGWLSTERLAFLAPMQEVRSYLDAFADALRLGRRTRACLDVELRIRAGLSVEDFDLLAMAPHAESARLLVVHDRQDRQMSYDKSVQLVSQWPGATLVSSTGLGHGGLLRNDGVTDVVVRFVNGEPVATTSPAAAAAVLDPASNPSA